MARQEDEATAKARAAEIKKERKNYTYRLPIYLAEMFSQVCEQKAISPVTLIEQWIGQYVSTYESKLGPDILDEIGDIIEAKKENERRSRQKQQKRKR